MSDDLSQPTILEAIYNTLEKILEVLGDIRNKLP